MKHIISLKHRIKKTIYSSGPHIEPLWLNNNPVRIYFNLNRNRNLIGIENRKRSIIYQWINLINSDIYIGSSFSGATRLLSYWAPSKLKFNIPINNSIKEYGHHNFALAILEDLGSTNLTNKSLVLNGEQKYLNILFNNHINLSLNICKIAGSTRGFRHSEQFKLNRTANPMFNRLKSVEFTYMQNNNKKEIENSIYSKSIKDIGNKLIYLFNKNLVLIGTYTTIECCKIFHISKYTLSKYVNSGKIFKNKIFSHSKI